MVQTPQQRRANEKFAKLEAAKRGKPESVAKPKPRQKPSISPGWIALLAFVVCGGVLFEFASLIPEILGMISSFISRWTS